MLAVGILRKRGWSGEEGCILCMEEAETVDHLFVGCETTSFLMECLLRNERQLVNCHSVDWLWEESRIKGGALGRWELVTVTTSWWVIWLEQNRRIFKNEKCTSGQLLVGIRSLRNLWALHCA